jgi:hypothetical protein
MCGLIPCFGLCHLIFIVARYILLTIQVRTLHLSSILLFALLLFYFSFNFFSYIVVLLEIW